MRLILAIVSFVVAAVLLAFGIVARTGPSSATSIDYTVATEGTAPVTVIDGAVLNAFDGRQTLRIGGDDAVVAAYARTTDVLAWVGDASVNIVSFQSEDGTACTPVGADDPDCGLVSEVQRGSEEVVPDPVGSDLWVEEYDAVGSLRMTQTLSQDVSVLIAADGTLPAPSEVTISWPVAVTGIADAAPWLIIVGAAFGVLGLVLLLGVIHRLRSGHGPRRSTHGGPPSGRGRRTGQKAAGVAGALVALAVAFAPGTRAEATVETPEPTPTTPTETTVPAVTERQTVRIIDRVIATVASADAANDIELAATRVTGAALEIKQADYVIRSQDAAQEPASPQLPTGSDVVLSLPQQVPADQAVWPRTLFVVVEPPAEPTPTATDGTAVETTDAALVGVLLTQEGPRSQYLVEALVTLVDDLPDVPSAADGTTLWSGTDTLLRYAPAQVTTMYADVLARDTASESYIAFDLESDPFAVGWGLASQNEQITAQQGQESPNVMTFTTTARPDAYLALATADGGAIVYGAVEQDVDVAPAESGAKVIAQGDVQLLSGVERSERGYITAYLGELLFYVPPFDSAQPMRLLGFSDGIIAAAEKS